MAHCWLKLKKSTYATAIVSPGVHEIIVDSVPRESAKRNIHNEGTIKMLSIDLSQGRAYYLDIRIPWGSGNLEPILTSRSEEEALSVLKDLKYVGNLTL